MWPAESKAHGIYTMFIVFCDSSECANLVWSLRSTDSSLTSCPDRYKRYNALGYFFQKLLPQAKGIHLWRTTYNHYYCWYHCYNCYRHHCSMATTTATTATATKELQNPNKKLLALEVPAKFSFNFLRSVHFPQWSCSLRFTAERILYSRKKGRLQWSKDVSIYLEVVCLENSSIFSLSLKAVPLLLFWFFERCIRLSSLMSGEFGSLSLILGFAERIRRPGCSCAAAECSEQLCFFHFFWVLGSGDLPRSSEKWLSWALWVAALSVCSACWKVKVAAP